MVGISIDNRRLVQVIDDALDQNTIDEMQRCIDTNKIRGRNDIIAYYKNSVPILDYVIKTFAPDLKYHGYETWFNKGPQTTSHRHMDDTVTYGSHISGERHNRMCPVIVIVYYMNAKETDANLHFTDDGMIVSPRTNRLVMFGGETWHQVITQDGIIGDVKNISFDALQESRVSLVIDVYKKMSEKWKWRSGKIYGEKINYLKSQKIGE